MELTNDDLNLLEQAYATSTQGNWRRCRTDQITTIEDTRAWLGRMVDHHPEKPQLEMLVAMVDGSDPGDILEDIETYVVPTVTGNGPTSEANAAFIELAHNWMPLLLEEIRQSRLLLSAFRPAVPR